MKRLVGPALSILDLVVDFEGVGAQITEFPDGLLGQELEVGGFVRRGLVPPGTDHLWGVQIQNVHAGAGQIITEFDPYALAPATIGNQWPDLQEIRDRFDFWIFGPLQGSVASGAFTGAQIDILYPSTRVAQIDVSGALAQTLAVFNGVVSVAGLREFMSAPGGEVQVPCAFRIPRGVTVRWVTQTVVAADLFCYFTCGLFPIGLGQDAQG